MKRLLSKLWDMLIFTVFFLLFFALINGAVAGGSYWLLSTEDDRMRLAGVGVLAVYLVVCFLVGKETAYKKPIDTGLILLDILVMIIAPVIVGMVETADNVASWVLWKIRWLPRRRRYEKQYIEREMASRIKRSQEKKPEVWAQMSEEQKKEAFGTCREVVEKWWKELGRKERKRRLNNYGKEQDSEWKFKTRKAKKEAERAYIRRAMEPSTVTDDEYEQELDEFYRQLREENEAYQRDLDAWEVDDMLRQQREDAAREEYGNDWYNHV